MAECLEAIPSVVMPYSTATFTSKGKVVVGHMHYDIVDAHTARLGVVDDVTSTLLALGEVVESQGGGSIVDILNTIIYIVEWYNRQNGAKNFV